MADTRMMTEDERNVLLPFCEQSVGFGVRDVFLVVISMTLPAAVMTAISLLVLVVVARLFGFEIANGAWQSHSVTFWGAIVVAGGWFLVCAISTIRHTIRRLENRKSAMMRAKKDLAGGKVREERLTVEGVKLFREPEHGMFQWFLRLSNGKVFVLYDYDSVDAERDYPADNRPTITIKSRLHVVTFPAFGLKRYSFSGETLPLPEHRVMSAAAQDWPEPESYCRTSWDNLERRFAS